MAAAQVFLVLVLVASAALAVLALRRPVLWRMAVRNAARRPRQTATVVAGLMIGTAIVASALVAGDSAGSAIRAEVYRNLGHVDETVTIDSLSFFPEEVHARLAADPEADYFDGAAPNVLWSAAVDSPRTGLFEPQVSLVGFDPAADAAFGDFRLRGGGTTDGRGLAADEAILTAELADELGVRAGDTLDVAWTLPLDPLIPAPFPLFGNVTGADAGGVPGVPAVPGATTSTPPVLHEVTVREGATRLTVILGWDPRVGGTGPPVQSLRVEAVSPSGERTGTAFAQPPQVPLWLNVTAPPTGTLEPGDWTLAVTGQPAADAEYRGVALAFYPVYDLASLVGAGTGGMGGGAGGGGDGTGDAEMEALMDALFPQVRREAQVRVAAVADGGRAQQFGFGQALFLRLDALQGMLERDGQVNLVKFSNPGGVVAGARGSDEGTARLERMLTSVQADLPHPAVQALEPHPRKQEFLELADTAGQAFTGFLLFAGSLSVLTGLLLIVNIFTMLAEERRSELGMARAVGMRRSEVVRLFLFEGSLYAVAAAAVGAVLGLGLAWVMVSVLNLLVAGSPDSFPPVPFVVDRDAVLIAFAVGALLTFATILLASWRASRMNVVRAIRRIEEPEVAGGRWRLLVGVPMASLGLLLTAAGWLFAQFTLQVFGPLLLVLGLGLALRRYVRRRRLDPVLAAALAVYTAATLFWITEFEDVQEANVVGPLRGVLLTLSVVVLVSYWEAGPRWLAHRLERLRGLRAVAKPAFAYPQHKKFRTGMTLAMFSLILLSVGFFSIFGALFATDPARQTGGFDIEATTTLQVDDLSQYDRGEVPRGTIASLHALAHYDTFDRAFITVEGEKTGQFGPPQHHLYGYDAAFAEAQEFKLVWRDQNYSDDREAYLDVLRRDDVAIVAYTYSTNEQGQDLAHGVGDRLQMHFGDGVRNYTIVGVQEQWHFPGVFLPRGEVERLFPNPDRLYLARVGPGVDAGDAAKLLESNYRDAGMDAEPSQELVAEEQAVFRQILGAMKLFLGIGLVVGVLSLGIVTSRSVLERRQEIGMMRAIGYSPQQVRRVFFLEVTLTVALAAAVGIACSLLVTYGVWYAFIRQAHYPYVVPWLEILQIVAVAYVVALAATAAPILRSAKIPPAEAVRYIE